MDPLNISAKFEVRGLTHSWDNSDLSPGGVQTPILGKGRPNGFGDDTVRKSVGEFLWALHGNVRFLYLYTFQRYCRFCAPARHFSHPTSSLPKSPHVPLEIDRCPLVYEERRCWATCPCNQFPRFLTYVFLIQQRHRQMEGRTDKQTDIRTPYNCNTLLCTIAVLLTINKDLTSKAKAKDSTSKTSSRT